VTAAILALPRRTFASVRKHRNYRLFFTGQVISLVGTWMQNIALAWYVIELTHSAVAVGFLAFCRFAPFTVFGLISGVAADRFDNRRLVMTTQTASMVVAAALTVLAFSGAELLWLAYVLAAAAGTALVFDAPGRHALTFQMVGREELPNAVALNASLFNASRVVGPGVAGVIIAAFGVGVCFALNTVSFLAVLTSLALMRPEELVPVVRPEQHLSWLKSIREGLGYARRSPRVRLILAMTTVVSTVGFNFHVLVPVLASETLDAGPRTFGILSAVFGAGALVGALLTASIGRASWKGLIAGVGGFSVSLLVLAPIQTVVACAILLFVVGICFTLWTSNSQSLLQLAAPDHLRGRVVSLWLFAFAGLAPLGGLFAGWLSHIGGTELAFFVAGVTGLLMTLVAVRELAPQYAARRGGRAASGAVEQGRPAALGAAAGRPGDDGAPRRA
jgi:MFS family permease